MYIATYVRTKLTIMVCTYANFVLHFCNVQVYVHYFILSCSILHYIINCMHACIHFWYKTYIANTCMHICIYYIVSIAKFSNLRCRSSSVHTTDTSPLIPLDGWRHKTIQITKLPMCLK